MKKLRHPVTAEALSKIYTCEVALTPNEYHKMQEIQRILFADSSDLRPNDEMDIKNIFEASKYMCTFFITTDRKHLLSKAPELFERFKLQVMLPSDCLMRVKPYIENKKAYYSDLFQNHP